MIYWVTSLCWFDMLSDCTAHKEKAILVVRPHHYYMCVCVCGFKLVVSVCGITFDSCVSACTAVCVARQLINTIRQSLGPPNDSILTIHASTRHYSN